MPIGLEAAQTFHPVELTRQASPETPLLQGDFTLDQLKEQFGTPDMAEEAVLNAAGLLGHAFFKVGEVYRSFAPMKGETVILSPSQESGVTVNSVDDSSPTSIDLENLSSKIDLEDTEVDGEEENDWAIVDDPDLEEGEEGEEGEDELNF